MEPDNLKALSLAILIIILGVIGIFVLMGLAISWKRYIKRQNLSGRDSNKKAKDDEYISIWEQAGKRLKLEDIEDDDYNYSENEQDVDDIDLKRDDLFDDEDDSDGEDD